MSGFSYHKGKDDLEFSWKDRSAQLNANLYPPSQQEKLPYNPFKGDTADMCKLEFDIIKTAIGFWKNGGE